MKPHIYWKNGRWVCRIFGLIGVGDSPVEAYDRWNWRMGLREASKL